MTLSRVIRVQLVIFSILTIAAVLAMVLVYMQIPAALGIAHYRVKVELPTTGGLYKTANVTYRGVQVGRVDDVALTKSGVVATLNMSSQYEIPSDLQASVNSTSAIGEQYVSLIPNRTGGPFLRDGDVIGADRTSVPQDVGPLIDSVNTSLAALPQHNLQTAINEGYKAFNGVGPALQRLLDTSHNVAGEAVQNTSPITKLITDAEPVLSAVDASDPSIRSWATSVNSLTGQLAEKDQTVRDLLVSGQAAANEATMMFNQLRPTTPVLLANLVSLEQVAVTYNASLEQLLVLLPLGAINMDTITYPNRNTTHAGFLSFNLNLNVPEPCTVGFLPASERRDGSAQDAPTRTARPLYCALPQSDQNAVRGARNYPCMDKPGKRAPTVEMCKSNEPYRPLGTNPWIGDPKPYVDNPLYGDLAAQQSASARKHPRNPSAPSVGTASYDPGSGTYVGSDGAIYTQADLAKPGSVGKDTSWQTMLIPG
ncbi:MCE family protein [Gordonia rubripertincta]|uniref:MCE family protein n=1 Tax=Gordonia rubripertincta TaxID=36822 RepID=UPI000B8D460D|nr:MlaD family protein [Gordonia rubripertincta]ASR03095.1 mce related protein [Gordonia rubripertincta]